MKRMCLILKHMLTALLTLCLALTAVTVPVSAATGVNVETPTQQQIRERFQQIYKAHDFKVTYAQKPVIAGSNYVAGSLSDETLSGAIDMLNGMRYIAGIPDDVKLNAEYTQLAQGGALVNAANDEMSHSPKKPSGMDDSLYQMGAKGCGSSNLYWNVSNFKDAIEGWISDEHNRSGFNQGHRRWCLNPAMQYTGFGKAGTYSVMYAFDNWKSGRTSSTVVAWPAQRMPLEFFNEDIAWSVSFGRTVSADNTSVTLTRTRDNKVWSFSKNAADGKFLVENSGYGQIGCVIFLPDDVGMYRMTPSTGNPPIQRSLTSTMATWMRAKKALL